MGKRKTTGGGDPLLYQRRISSSEIPLHIPRKPKYPARKIYTKASEYRTLIAANAGSSLAVILPKKFLDRARRDTLEAHDWTAGDTVEVGYTIDQRDDSPLIVIKLVHRDSRFHELQIEFPEDEHKFDSYEPRQRPAGKGRKR